jgi:hypothetical protein
MAIFKIRCFGSNFWKCHILWSTCVISFIQNLWLLIILSFGDITRFVPFIFFKSLSFIGWIITSYIFLLFNNPSRIHYRRQWFMCAIFSSSSFATFTSHTWLNLWAMLSLSSALSLPRISNVLNFMSKILILIQEGLKNLFFWLRILFFVFDYLLWAISIIRLRTTASSWRYQRFLKTFVRCVRWISLYFFLLLKMCFFYR